MFSKMLNWVGVRAKAAVTLLALVVAANVILQMYTHKTTALTAWKGGGFGMYTEPHGEDRSVWLQVAGVDGIASIRLWPPTDAFQDWRDSAGVSGRTFLDGFQRRAARMRFFPRESGAQDLISRAARMRWPENQLGTVTPREGRLFAKTDIHLIVYENRFDIASKSVTRYAVFEYGGGEK